MRRLTDDELTLGIGGRSIGSARRAVGFGLIATLAVLVGAYGIMVLVNPGSRIDFFRDRFARFPLAAGGHVLGGSVALLLGPWQFLRRLRPRIPVLHRSIGRVYLVACVIGSTAGGFLARYSMGGLAGHFGFGLLALAWFATTMTAYRAIRAGDRVRHSQWMVRSFALTLAAVTLRLYLPTSAALGIPFDIAYPGVAWLCWVPNLLLAEWLLRRHSLSSSGAARAPSLRLTG
jgi:uncharacterized membrane protein